MEDEGSIGFSSKVCYCLPRGVPQTRYRLLSEAKTATRMPALSQKPLSKPQPVSKVTFLGLVSKRLGASADAYTVSGHILNLHAELQLD